MKRTILSSLLGLFCCTLAPAAAELEIVTWPYHADGRLSVLEDGVQPFYVMAYDRKAELTGATRIEIDLPDRYQLWDGREAPPEAATAAFHGVIPLRRHRPSRPGSYRSSESAGNLLLVLRPLPGAAPRATARIRWFQDQRLLAEREIRIELLRLPHKIVYSADARPMVGLWVNNPRFHPETLKLLYRSFAAAGVNYLILDRDLAERSTVMLQPLGIKIFLNQWWPYHGYLPGAPPPEAQSTLKDGSADAARWSPTYMAENGDAFRQELDRIAAALRGHDGIYGLMLDYEPTAKGMDADYGEASRRAFERSLGKTVANWPGDALPGGTLFIDWVAFRCRQSTAYVEHFRTRLRQDLPGFRLAVSTSGASGRPDDINRNLAATDIAEISVACDSIHPQLYSWTTRLDARELPRFTDKLELGLTTLARASGPVYVCLGSSSGTSPEADPEVLKIQLYNWWLSGRNFAGVEIWQYFYGVDARYLVMLNEAAALMLEAGAMPKQAFAPADLLADRPDPALRPAARLAADERTAWLGVTNLGGEARPFSARPRPGWKLASPAPESAVAPRSFRLLRYEKE